ncbi:MAG: cysteine--tRNA ligase, partial [Candidatus Nealsonbacteria bacterium CG23_combo_of_CG06-09_8_20_14_all_36_125]
IFPHHENEIAQSEAYTGKKFVNFWLHNEHLLVEGKKMSKSLGNFYTLRDLLKRGYAWRAIRYFLLNSHYRQKTNLSFKALKGTEKAIERIKTFIEKMGRRPKVKTPSQNLKLIKSLISKAKKDFGEAMDEDLNTSKALSAIFNLIKEANKIEEVDSKTVKQILNLINKFDSVFGLKLLETKKGEIRIPEKVIKLLKKREGLRKLKHWGEADEMRIKIKQMGYWVEDTKEGSKIKKL